jgi:hypothetical protein
MSVESLRSRIATALAEGVLPRDRPIGVTRSPGSGAPCEACGAAIPPAEPEYRLRFLGPSWNPYDLAYHALCHAIWEQERRRRAA